MNRDDDFGVYPDDEAGSAKRTVIRTRNVSLGNGRARVLGGEQETYEISGEEVVVVTDKIFRELEDGTILHLDEQIKRVGNCETFIQKDESDELTVCGLEGLMKPCSSCGRLACRLHRKIISKKQRVDPELSEEFDHLPQHLAGLLFVGKFACNNCLEDLGERAEVIEKNLSREGFLGGVWRFLTAPFRSEY